MAFCMQRIGMKKGCWVCISTDVFMQGMNDYLTGSSRQARGC